MRYFGSMGVVAFSAALLVNLTGVSAQDVTKYPDLRGQWTAIGGSVKFVPDKPRALGQEAPLTAEYQAIFEANLRDMAEGGQGTDPTTWCLSPGMPRVTNGYGEMEFVVTPETTHILVFHVLDSRRIFTDGREFPTDVEPSFLGISIGRWIDTHRDGRYDVLEVETRNLKGPRSFDASGLPLHVDNQTIVKERYTFDRNVPDVINNEVTVFDHALTPPWTVTKHYRRSPNPHPWWVEDIAWRTIIISGSRERPTFSAPTAGSCRPRRASGRLICDISISRRDRVCTQLKNSDALVPNSSAREALIRERSCPKRKHGKARRD